MPGEPRSWCEIYGYSSDQIAAATKAGAVVIEKGSKGSQTVRSMSRSFVLPVRKGQSAQLVCTWHGESSGQVQFAAFPFGKYLPLPAASEPAEAAARPAPPPSEARRVPKAERIAALAAAAAELLGHRVEEGTRERFAAVLERNVVDHTNRNREESADE